MIKRVAIRAISCVLLAALALSLLAGCDGAYKMTIKDNMYYIRSTGVYYKAAPLNYMPVGKDTYDTPYARYKNGDFTEIYHTVAAGVDPEDYLALVYDNYVSGLMHASDITLPGYREFEADRALVLSNTEVWVSYAEIDTEEGIDKILSAFENGEKIEYPASEAVESYRLTFTSEKYPAFTMTLIFYHYGEGRTYLFNRGTRECRIVPDDLLDEFFDREEGGDGALV